uniref:Ig-like domain-containing protein n=1 Tax=Brevundimonas sp. TaxID=1871086 RepID=UPI0026096432
NAAIQYLAAGQTLTQTYTVTVDDGQGGTVSQPVTVTITGTNDAPTITAAVSTGAVTEDGTLSAGGAIAFADVDLRDGHSVTSTAVGSGYLGTFTATVTDDGSNDGAGSVTWNFELDNVAADYLNSGQNLTQSYTVSVSDGNGGTVDQVVTVTIAGQDDNAAPTITSAVSSGAVAVSAAATSTASGVVNFADIDLADVHTATSAANGSGYLGTFTTTVTDNGAGDGAGSLGWSFQLDNATGRSLSLGQVLTQTYSITVSDGEGGSVEQPVTITITGTNDAPVVQSVSAAAREDGPAVIAAFSADDVDGDDDAGSLVYAITSNPTEGTVVNNGDGTFSFNPGAAFQNLAEGQTRNVTFGYTATDRHGASTPGSVTVTVTGANDAPVVSDVTRTAGFSAGLPLAIGGYGTALQAVFSLRDANGDGRVETANSIAGLGGVGFSYGIASGDIDGDGDVDIAVASNAGTYVFTNRGDTNGDGVAEFTGVQVNTGFVGYDVALGDLNGDGRLDLVSSQNGALTEMINLGDSNGNGVVDNFSVRAVTGGATGGSSYGITTADMNGDGRTDILLANWSSGPTEIRYNLGDTNGDGRIDYRSQIIEDNFDESGLGVVTGDIDGDGDLDFLLSRWNGSNEVVYLNNGDANGDGLLEFSTIELPTGGWTLESELIDIDRDGDLDIVSTELSGNARILYNQGDNNSDGRPEFVIQSIVGATSSYGLAVGDVDGDGDLDIVFPSLSTGGAILMENRGDTDGNGQLDFTRTSLVGVNASWDAEFVRIGGGTGAFEDGPAITGAFDGDDVDSDDDGDSLTYTITSAPAEGTVVNNGDGTFSFSPGSDFQDLGRGETRTVTFTYTATDSRGAVSSPATVTLTVAGTNDGPVARVDAASTASSTAVTINVRANDTDVDGDVVNVSHINGVAIALNQTVAAANGTVRLNADGTLTYQPAPFFTGQVAFTYSISDGNGGTSTSTVNVSVAPQLSGAPVLSAKDLGPVGTTQVLEDKAPSADNSGSDAVVPSVGPDVSSTGKSGNGPLVLPGATDGPDVEFRAVSDRSANGDAGPQILPAEPDLGLESKDAGPQTVPVDPDLGVAARDAGPQILPAEPDLGLESKDAGVAQIFPGLANDGFMPTTIAAGGPTGRDWIGLAARLEDGPALAGLGADDFLTLSGLEVGPQVLPDVTGLDLDGLFAAPSEMEMALADALTALTPDPMRPLPAFEAEPVLHVAPDHDPFA